ncbi:MAG: HlyD family secretion protein [Planctomycetota bacterium]
MSSSEAAEAPLFRPEVLQARRTQWLGTVLLARPHLHKAFAACGLLLTIGVVGVLGLGRYSRKARLKGWLVPREGLVQVFPPQAGVVTALEVREGQPVARGERLLVISAEVESARLGATRAEVSRRLAQRRDSLLTQGRRVLELAAQHAQALRARLVPLAEEARHLRSELELQRRRDQLAAAVEERQRALQRDGLASAAALLPAAQDRLEQGVRLHELERQAAGVERERVALQGELDELPLRASAEAADLERQASALEQELAEAEAQREVVLTAPEAGTVTAIQVVRGGRPDPARPLLTIVPARARLDAQLVSPSRTVGFLRPGQRVLLRYDAYPYQRFGHQVGVVAEISRTALSASGLPPGLGAAAPGAEPVYLLTVRLQRQEITAYGRGVPLQPGMQLEADVVLETRRLYEWALDPLYTITGRGAQ